MQKFRVGGFVRDMLLGVPAKDTDWVVVGETIESMKARGFSLVRTKSSRDNLFVFICPETGDELAMARTETPNGDGHADIIVHIDDITLEQDLVRRDLTINAMAMDVDGNVIDLHGGQDDLRNGVLRHVSDAFQDDPLRVVRVARFAARFPTFTIADETLQLMRDMVVKGKLNHLPTERFMTEFIKCFEQTTHPSRMFRVLLDVGALDVILPELVALVGVLQPAEFHPEGDAFEHTMLCVDQVGNVVVRWAALLHDTGKGVTPQELWPKHPGHDLAGAKINEALCDRLKTSAEMKDLAILAAALHMRIHQSPRFGPKGLVKLLRAADALRKGDRFEDLLSVVAMDARGRIGHEQAEVPELDVVRRALAAIKSVDCEPIALACKHRDQIRPAIDRAFANAIRAAQ